MKDTNFYTVQGWMINQLHLSGNELICYAIIHNFSQDGQSMYMGSLKYLQTFMNASQPTVIKALKSLVEKGLIEKHEETKNNVRVCYYSAVEGTKDSLVGGTKDSLVWGTKDSLDNNIKNNKEINKEKINKNKETTKEGFVFDDDREANFIKWCNENVPNLMENKRPLTYKQFNVLLSEFTRDEILDKMLYINAISNFNRKYKDVYGVLRNWLKGDKDPNYTQRFKNRKKTA